MTNGELQKKADEFNKRHPIGSTVRVKYASGTIKERKIDAPARVIDVWDSSNTKSKAVYAEHDKMEYCNPSGHFNIDNVIE